MMIVKMGVSFLVGVYVGTYFDCKPHLKNIEQFVRDNMPKKR